MDSASDWLSKSKIMKRDDDFGEDRISELPEEILLHILSYLPAKDLVATSALAKNWKTLWTFFSILNFDFDELRVRNPPAGPAVCLDLIQRELHQIPDTARIQKFRLRFALKSYTSHRKTVLMSLLSDIVRLKVEELDCLLLSEWKYFKLLPLPDSLFTCKSLTSLKLAMAVRLKIPSTLCFPSLKTLHLLRAKFQNEHSAQLLISGCLVLEELLLKECSWKNFNGLTISIATLQRLYIYVRPSSNIILRISSPNIQSFRWSSSSLFQLVQCNLPSLTDAELFVVPWGNSSQKVHLAHRTLELFERISGIKSLTISSYTLRTISRAESLDADRRPVFYNLIDLKVIAGVFRFKLAALIHILRKSPNLQSLDFPNGFELAKEVENQILKDAVPLCLITSLKTFRISNFKGGAKELRFLDYIRKNATGLDFTILRKEENHFPNNTVPSCLNHSLKTFRVSKFGGSEKVVCFLKYVLENAYVLESFSVHCSEYLSRDLERKEHIERELMKLYSIDCKNVLT